MHIRPTVGAFHASEMTLEHLLQDADDSKQFMVCAPDRDGSAVVWSPLGLAWRLEDRHGYTAYYPTLRIALAALLFRADVSPRELSLSDNPYL